MKPRQFVDSVKIYVAGGDGGNGCCSFRREKYIPKGGPDGGDGGRGGDVILQADPDTDYLTHLAYAPHQRADRGLHGKGKQMHGRNGAHRIVKVPCGTEVWDGETHELLADLLEPRQEFVVARGGKGGLGNPHWQTATHQTPYECTPGAAGEKRTLRLELKLIAQFALVGFPNAGKSSLLGRISHAHPKVAPYPFTTLAPVIGTVECEDYTRLTVADIPGIVKGAHDGTGLGDRFLRHIERTPFLIFVIDMAGSEERKPEDDYRILRQELELYRHELLRRAALVVANKMDLPTAAENLARFRRKTKTEPIPVSAATGDGIDTLKRALCQRVRWQAG